MSSRSPAASWSSTCWSTCSTACSTRGSGWPDVANVPAIRASAGRPTLDVESDGLADELSRRDATARMLRPLLRSKVRLAGLAILVLFVCCAALAPLLTPYDPAVG